MAGLVARVDSDGDALISKAEYARYTTHKNPFRLYDHDGDGFLNANELTVAVMDLDPTSLLRQQRRPDMGPQSGNGSPQPGMAPPQGANPPLPGQRQSLGPKETP